MIQHSDLPLDLVQFDLALELFFFAVSILVSKLPSTVEFIPNQCNMAGYPANVVDLGLEEMLLFDTCCCCRILQCSDQRP